MEKLSGLIAAPYTPMYTDGSVNLGMIESYASFLVANGVSGAFICGTTGEGTSLAISERKAIAEKWASACKGKGLALIVHVGHNSIEEAKLLAKHAQAIGANSIAALAPSYFRPASIDSLVEVCANIAGAAKKLPFYYYHIPGMTGVELSMPAFLKAASKHIPTLAGIKYSTSDLMKFRQCATIEKGRFTMLFGSDEMLLGALAMGAEGAVGSTYNYAASNYLHMIEAFKNNDLDRAQAYTSKAVDLVDTLLEFGVMQAGKAIMGMRGIDCGPVRLPLVPLSQNQTQQLYEQIKALAIFESITFIPPTSNR